LRLVIDLAFIRGPSGGVKAEVRAPKEAHGNGFAAHAQALPKSKEAMIDDSRPPELSDPKYWMPLAVVGEPAAGPGN
jgi:hypothetical protein